MKLSFERVSRPVSLAGIVLLCGLTVVGCDKKQESETTDKTEDTNTEVVAVDPVVQCDDQVALTQLQNSIQSTLGSQTQNLFTAYAENVGVTASSSGVKNVVNSVLVDIANPQVIQEANNQGMVTCSASLSLTLPNPEVSRANKVTTRSDGRSLSEVLRSQSIVLNNNMLVSDNFNYVVGMQGGQATARVVGQPAILTAAADIIAKSRVQAVIDANRAAPATKQPRPAPAMPAAPAQPAEPRPRPEPEQRPKPRQTQPAESAKVESQTQQKPAAAVEPAKPQSTEVQKSVEDNQSKNLSVPKNDDIEMVIVEEEGTY